MITFERHFSLAALESQHEVVLCRLTAACSSSCQLKQFWNDFEYYNTDKKELLLVTYSDLVTRVISSQNFLRECS